VKNIHTSLTFTQSGGKVREERSLKGVEEYEETHLPE